MALLQAFLRSPSVSACHVAPGSDRMAQLAPCHPVSENDFQGLIQLAQKIGATLTVVGPENPLAAGIVDAFQKAGLVIWGPTQAAARIESSKSYAKHLMEKAHVPTAKFLDFTDLADLNQWLQTAAYPLVLKDNGLCAGKGVTICHTLQEALEALPSDRSKPHPYVVEEFLTGVEFSLIVLANNQTYVSFPVAQDHKPLLDGNKGPNTGGMGAVSPVPFVTEDLLRQAEKQVIQPVLKALAEDGNPFTGFLYAGLMLTPTGLQVIEFNARFGDPEAEVILPRLTSDLAEAIRRILKGEKPVLSFSEKTCVGFVLSSPGYPVKVTDYPQIPDCLLHPETVDSSLGTIVMGAKQDPDSGQWLSSGGRVLLIHALGESISDCQEKLLTFLKKEAGQTAFHYRTDIGNFAL